MGTTHGHAPTSPVRRVLFNQRYWPFFAGMLASNSGTWFQNIAQVLLVYRLTNSPFWVGVVNFAQFAPILFLAPLGGSAADRFDRRKLVISMQTGATALATLWGTRNRSRCSGGRAVLVDQAAQPASSSNPR